MQSRGLDLGRKEDFLYMRVSMHSGKTGSAVHNERKFNLDKAEHINQDLTDQNTYWCWTDDYRFSNGESFADAEREWYHIRYKEHLDAVNARYIKQRHPERCKTADDLYKGDKTRPSETIWQIGNKDEAIPADVLLASYKQMSAERERMTKGHLQVLDWALHVDERGGAHIHERVVWECRDKDGNLMLGQNQALKELGVPLPEPDKPEGRFNNRKISFDGQMRELWQSIVQDMGLEIETEPIPGRRHLRTEEYIYDQQRKHIQQNQERFTEASKALQEARDALEDIKGLTGERMEVLERLKADIEASKRELGIVKDARPHGTAKRSLFNKDIYKLHKEEYLQLLAKAAIADSLKDTASTMEQAHNAFMRSAMQEAEARVKDSYSVEIAMLKAEQESQKNQAYYYQLGKLMEPVASQEQKEQAMVHVQNITKARD